MREDSGSSDPPVALASGAGTVTGADVPVVPVALRRVLRRGDREASLARVTVGPVAGRVAVATLIVATFAIVATASAGPSILVPRSAWVFPNWEAGPLHYLFPRLITNPQTLGLVFSSVLVVMLVAYFAALAAVRTLSMRTIAIAVAALHLILLLSPPMQLTDLFNYVGYSRLGALHHLNPYTHVIRQAVFDPVFSFTSWHNLRSPYGWLFTALTYPLGFVSLPIAYWTLKIVTVLLSLGFVLLVWDLARRLGRDARFAVAFVALNPVFLIYEVGAFHNDFFMLMPALGAIRLVLARRPRTAGAVLMLAVAVKFTVVLILPFLLLAAQTRKRQKDVLVGCVLGAVPLATLILVMFGPVIPNLAQQSEVLTAFSIPNLFGVLFHLGGATPWLLRIADVGVVGVIAHQFLRNRDWLSGAGWSTLALIASLGWLTPWYVVWLLPLAALAANRRLKAIALVLTAFLLLTFVPATTTYLKNHNINLLDTPAGQAAASLQNQLSQ
jgi:glycosyl transferase family 87